MIQYARMIIAKDKNKTSGRGLGSMERGCNLGWSKKSLIEKVTVEQRFEDEGLSHTINGGKVS